MNQAITVSEKTIDKIIVRLDALTKEVRAIKAKLFESELPYGSDAWWKKEIEEAKKEIKQGKIRELQSVSELRKPLKQLFP